MTADDQPPISEKGRRPRRLRPLQRNAAPAGHKRPPLRASINAGANASVLPAFSVVSLVGFGAVVAALPAFEALPDWVLRI